MKPVRKQIDAAIGGNVYYINYDSVFNEHISSKVYRAITTIKDSNNSVVPIINLTSAQYYRTGKPW